SERWSSTELTPRVQSIDGFSMIVDSRVHGTNQADVIGNLAETGHQFAQIHTTLTIFSEPPWTAKQFAAGLPGIVVLDVSRIGLQMQLIQHRLWIKHVDMTGSPLHEHRDHRRRLRLFGGSLWL